MPILDMAFNENYKNLGYPFYIVLTTNEVGIVDLFFKYYGKRFSIKMPCWEIYLIKEWLPIAKPKSLFQIEKQRQEIICQAQRKLTEKDIDWENWEEIPF